MCVVSVSLCVFDMFYVFLHLSVSFSAGHREVLSCALSHFHMNFHMNCALSHFHVNFHMNFHCHTFT